ncbi:MAG TPA: hypothetical protein DCL54_03865 [Alphaproteobacteria bacterium]|nr:hypothetical protein [Alphaproteobacteria bacterium]HAJ45701.1 hypothetical protein [Alphaproteobacteria bacterium]
MLNILKAKLARAERQDQLAKLVALRRYDDEAFDANTLVPGPAWRKAAEESGVPLAHIVAVYMVESAGSGFNEDGRLTVLYEPHVAYKFAKRPKEAQAQAPHLFYPKWIDPSRIPKREAHPYRTSQEERWDMILEAAGIDFDAAVRAVSWGRFQIMGYWAEKLDYDSPMHFIERLYDGEAAHLDAFLRYCRMAGLMTALQRGDWFGFSKYNSNIIRVRKEYSAKLAAAADKSRMMA